MSHFLTNILATKQTEVSRLHQHRHSLQAAAMGMPPARGFAAAIKDSTGLAVVAEVKKASPSKGVICADFDPVRIATTYQHAGANAISVLTDETYFQGSIEYLRRIRSAVELPLLRKDFIIDEVQILESRAAGADAILLICAAMPPLRLRVLSAFARTCGLEVLIEIHTRDEVETALAAAPSVLGINNRNLHTFEVSLAATESLISTIPACIPVISESGIHKPEDAQRVAKFGAKGILVGESLMTMSSATSIERAIGAFQGCELMVRVEAQSV